MSKVEVTGVSFEGHRPVSITIRIGDTESCLTLESIWSALLQSSFTFIDPFSIRSSIRAAIIGRDGRPDFAVIKVQDNGHLFVRVDGLSGERYSPEHLQGKIVRPEQMPILMAFWLRSIRKKMEMDLPKIQKMT